MNSTDKIIVLDANILIRAVLGIKTFSLIAEQRDKVLFYTPDVCYCEVSTHLPTIIRKRDLTPAEDQDFFGTGIATWRTKNIGIFFNE